MSTGVLAVERSASYAPTPQKSLVAKLAEVMAAVERIPKRGRNAFHGYDYAMEADIVATVRQELAARHVMLIPEVQSVSREPVGEKGAVLTTLTMRFMFRDGDSNEAIERAWVGCGSDKDDKGVYKAMTGGEKYFLLKTFLMPTGDDPEADHERPAKRSAPAGVNPETGVDTADDPLPAGFHYLASVTQKGEWYDARVDGWDSQGGSFTFSTKRERIGEILRQAYQEGLPVRIDDYTPKKNGKGEGYVNKVTVWRDEPVNELPPAPDDSEMPF